MDETRLEGRNSVLEAYKAKRTVDKLYLQEGIKDNGTARIVQEAKRAGTVITYLSKEKMDGMSETKAHQGVIAVVSAVVYSTIDEILDYAAEKGEDPFVFVLDGVEDPHNLGAIIRTANTAGAHGVIIPKRRSATVTGVVAKASAGAVNHTRIAKVTNIGNALDELKKRGLWTVAADMDGECMYGLDLRGPVAMVAGSEGKGISRIVKEKCDFIASIPLMGEINSLNVSVAAGVLAYEIVRQRMLKKFG